MSDVKIFQYSLPETVSKCQEFYGKTENQRLRIGVGLDGSEVVKKAMKNIQRLVNIDRGDILCGLHVEDPKKNEMHPTLKPDFLKRQFERLAYPLRRSSLHWFMREKEGDGSTYSCLTQLAQQNNIDLLVVGNIGRTQSKQETAKKDLGHIAESVWRLCQSSVCVVKSSSYDLDIERGATWLVAADGGHAAMMAFCYVIFRLHRPQDEVIVHYYGSSDDIASDKRQQMLEEYREALKQRGIKGRAEGIVTEGEATVSSQILHQCSRVQADFLVLGLSGYTREKLGSVSHDVLGAARCSVLAIKDPLESSKM